MDRSLALYHRIPASQLLEGSARDCIVAVLSGQCVQFAASSLRLRCALVVKSAVIHASVNPLEPRLLHCACGIELECGEQARACCRNPERQRGPAYTNFIRMLEARGGIEPPNRGFADLGLTTWLPRPRTTTTHFGGLCAKPSPATRAAISGAGDGI